VPRSRTCWITALVVLGVAAAILLPLFLQTYSIAPVIIPM
jgi:hypothetical protein